MLELHFGVQSETSLRLMLLLPATAIGFPVARSFAICAATLRAFAQPTPVATIFVTRPFAPPSDNPCVVQVDRAGADGAAAAVPASARATTAIVASLAIA